MRRSSRPPVECPGCRAKLVWLSNFPWGSSHPNLVEAPGIEPPDAEIPCPKCGGRVSTIDVYPYLPGFPMSFNDLRAAYAGFKPIWETDRGHIEEELAK